METEENTELKKEIISLSIRKYIAEHHQSLLFYTKKGMPVYLKYSIDDLAVELSTKVTTIRRWGREGYIPHKYAYILIKKGILPKEWEHVK